MKLRLTAEQLAKLQHIRQHCGEDDGPDGERAFYCKGCQHMHTRCTCAEEVHEMLPAILDTLAGMKADVAFYLRQIDRQQLRIASLREEQKLVDALTTAVQAVRSQAREKWMDLLARHDREKAQASGSDSPHSAASGARSEERSAERTEPDPEVLRVRAPAGAAADDQQADRRPGQGDGAEAASGPGAVGGPAQAAGGEGLPGQGEPVAAAPSTAPRRCAKCGLAENDHDVRHVFVPAGGRR